MDAYELMQIVGKGAFGKVFKVSQDLALLCIKIGTLTFIFYNFRREKECPTVWSR